MTDANAPRFPYKGRGALAYMGGGWSYLTVGKGMVWVAA